MEILLLFLCVFLMLKQGVLSPVQLTQSDTGAAKPGDTLRLTCAVSGASITDGYGYNWVRQPPNKGLEWMGRGYYSSSTWYTNYASAFRSRVSISPDSSKNEFSLQLSTSTTTDTAVYYCARRPWGAGSGFRNWGQGTTVTVTSENQTGPSLFPLISLSETIPSNGLMTVGCLAKDVPPAFINFSWDDYNNVSINAKYVTQYPTVGSPARTFSSVSQVSISANDWRNFQPFFCKAEHVDGAARVVRHTPCIEPEMIIRAPRLEDFESSNPNATIVCMAVNLHSTSTTVQWLKNGRSIDSDFATTGPVAVGPNGYSIISELLVDRRDWISDKTFSCEVRNENFTGIKNISRPRVCDLGPCSDVQVHVETIPPSFTDIFMTKLAKLTCRISNMPYDQEMKELEVIWTRERDNTKLDTKIGKATPQESNELVFVDATTTVCPEEWESGETFKCKVIIPSLLPTAETRTLKKLQDSPSSAPAVYVLPPPSEQLALQETATITCLLKDFYPNNFFVKWMRNNEPVAASEYFVSKPIQESKTPKRYSTYSMLNIKEKDWNYGDIFTCVVGHEALPYWTTQKTVDKNTGKPTHVNVSLVLSESAKTCY